MAQQKSEKCEQKIGNMNVFMEISHEFLVVTANDTITKRTFDNSFLISDLYKCGLPPQLDMIQCFKVLFTGLKEANVYYYAMRQSDKYANNDIDSGEGLFEGGNGTSAAPASIITIADPTRLKKQYSDGDVLVLTIASFMGPIRMVYMLALSEKQQSEVCKVRITCFFLLSHRCVPRRIVMM